MNDFVKPVLVLLVICLVMSGALAFGNALTAPIIEEAERERMSLTMSEIIPHAEGFVSVAVTEDMPSSVIEIYVADNNVGYIFMTAASGYGGDVVIMCGISPNGTIIDSEVLSHSETQGLGTVVFDIAATQYPGSNESAINNIDAVSGATITSEAYRRAVMDAFTAFEIVRN